MKKLKPPLTIEQQIKLLSNDYSLIIDDYGQAYNFLNRVSYYRFINAYSLNLKTKNKYNEGISFSYLVRLYDFNTEIRQLLYPIIEDIEIAFRAAVVNTFSTKYGNVQYLDPINFDNEDYHVNLMAALETELERNANNPSIRHYNNEYCGVFPLYVCIEVFSFGMLSKFYKNMLSEDRQAIAKMWGHNQKYITSWMQCLVGIRNICAHYGRLYNFKLLDKPMLYREYDQYGNDRLFAAIIVLKYMTLDKSKWLRFITGLGAILDKFNEIDLTCIGFPDNWESILRKEPAAR